MAKRKCSNCKEYFQPEEMYRPTGVQAFCSKECLNKKRYRPGFSPKRKIPKSVRKAVFDRDRHICAYCGRSQSRGVDTFLQAHHILYRSEGGQHTADNLVTLCQSCHSMVHSNKKKWQRILLTYVDRMAVTGTRGNLASMEKTMGNET